MTKIYEFKFYINAAHRILIHDSFGEEHPHTWEMSLILEKQDSDFLKFEQFEQRIEQLLLPFQDVLLNEIPPFHQINPTLENFCDYLKGRIEQLLDELPWKLRCIKMSETPVRSYLILC